MEHEMETRIGVSGLRDITPNNGESHGKEHGR